MTAMHAAVFESVGRPLEVREVEIDEPRSAEVLVRLVASGVCHSDYHVVLGEWAAPLPIVLGHEGAGVVEAVGPGVETVRVGDHVVLSWSPSCGRCRYCVSGRPQLCSVAAETTYGSVMFDGTTRLRLADTAVHSYLAVGSFGAMAVVPESAAIPIRRDVPLDRAALVGCAVTTGIGAVVNTAGVRPGASVVVIGCGGVGLSAIMGARLVSALPIIAIDTVEEKLSLARRMGATETVNARSTDVIEAVREITGGVGADYAFEAIGLPRTIEQAYECLAPGGTAVVVGQTPENATITVDPFVMSDRERRLIGSNYGSSRASIDFPRILDLYMAGRIDLDAMVSNTIRLDGINEAFDAMHRGETVRTVITYDS